MKFTPSILRDLIRLVELDISWEDAIALSKIAKCLDKIHVDSCEMDSEDPVYLRRESRILKRLKQFFADYPELGWYEQHDPRGMPLYVGKKETTTDPQIRRQYDSVLVCVPF
jgi:hypothetical protein